MRKVTYSMSVSLDGYIVGPDGKFDWTAPDEEVFRFWIDDTRPPTARSTPTTWYSAPASSI